MRKICFEDTMMDMTYRQVEEFARNNAAVLFPIGVIEEHGPHLPLCSDIAWSYAVAKRVKDKLAEKKTESVIAPPYFYGVNFCTGAFPGTFSLKPETFTQVLFEIFDNLKGFGFKEVYCFNYHGDAHHVNAILKAVQNANEKGDISVRLVFDAMDLGLYGFTGEEDFLLVVDPQYPMSVFEKLPDSEEGKLDIHAGAYETGMLYSMYPQLVDTDAAKTLPSTSLTGEDMEKWLAGGEVMKDLLPDGYAGNPSGYEQVSRHAEEIIALQVENIASKITS